MKRVLITTSIAALLLASTAAWAGGGHDGDKHDRGDRYGHDDGRDHDGDRDHSHKRKHHDNGRHLGQIKNSYRRGDRAPDVYLQQRYYVQDYRAYDLAPPPRGYRWVRPENDRYLLVEAATGVISRVLGY